MAKYKMTGCARFFIFLLIIGPIAYFGSKYLIDNGHLEGLKDKLEQNDSQPTTIDPSPERIPSDLANEDYARLQNRFDKLREGYLQQEATIKQQAITIAEQEQEIAKLKGNNSPSTVGATTKTTPPSSNTTSGNNPNTGSTSLDDLLREADQNLGTTPSSTSGTRQTIGQWRFSFASVQGNIEIYQDRGKILSKTTIDGSGKMTIDELFRQGDRFNVKGSASGEYYIIKSNGDLDAYDQGGYQTTCKKI